ncbi:MAG: hypothetical protein ACLFVG_03520 [Candidatus Aminicenantes bacterium]
MKKAEIIVLAVLVLSLLAGGILFAESEDDIQAIKKAVKKNPAYQEGKEVKWFKVLVTDNKRKKDKVRITVPISVVEFFIKCADEEHLRINREECGIDLKELFQELKKLGPMALIEVYEDEETVKIWLE